MKSIPKSSLPTQILSISYPLGHCLPACECGSIAQTSSRAPCMPSSSVFPVSCLTNNRILVRGSRRPAHHCWPHYALCLIQRCKMSLRSMLTGVSPCESVTLLITPPSRLRAARTILIPLLRYFGGASRTRSGPARPLICCGPQHQSRALRVRWPTSGSDFIYVPSHCSAGILSNATRGTQTVAVSNAFL